MPLQGDFKDFPLEEILDLVNAGKKSGELEIQYTDEDGIPKKISIYFKNGEVVYASSETNNGFPVIETAAKLLEGNFAFVPGDVDVQDEEFKKYQFAEFKKKLKEIVEKWKPLKEAFPTLNSVVKLVENGPEKLDLTKSEWSVISNIGNSKTIKELMDITKLGELTLLETLKRLKEKGVIEVEVAKPIGNEVLNYVPKRIRSVTFARPKDITVSIDQEVFELIDNKRTIADIAQRLGVSPLEVKESVKRLAELNRVVKPEFS
jgi:DNA-binding Lrp family transcriptional regulator